VRRQADGGFERAAAGRLNAERRSRPRFDDLFEGTGDGCSPRWMSLGGEVLITWVPTRTTRRGKQTTVEVIR
jgi:hypothetical protein